MQNTIKLLNSFCSTELLQKLRFSLVGVINTSISYMAFVILLHLLSQYIVASVLSFLIGMVVSFILNRGFVFRSSSRKRQFVPFCLVNLVSLCCSTGSLYVFVDIVGIYVYLSQAMSIFVSMVINYLGYRAIFTHGTQSL